MCTFPPLLDLGEGFVDVDHSDHDHGVVERVLSLPHSAANCARSLGHAVLVGLCGSDHRKSHLREIGQFPTEDCAAEFLGSS